MNLTQLNSAKLKSLLKLTERRDALLEELNAIEAELGAALSGSAPAKAAPAAGKRRGRKPAATKAPKAAKAGRPAKAPKAEKAAPAAKAPAAGGKSAGRGKMRDAILAALEQAGETGLTMKELAAKVKNKPSNLHVWFSTTGKKLPQIKRADGKYFFAN